MRLPISPPSRSMGAAGGLRLLVTGCAAPANKKAAGTARPLLLLARSVVRAADVPCAGSATRQRIVAQARA